MLRIRWPGLLLVKCLCPKKKNRETPNFRTSVSPLFKSIELLPPFPANSLKIIWDILPVVIRLHNRCTLLYTHISSVVEFQRWCVLKSKILAKNQYTQTKPLYFENMGSTSSQKILENEMV